MAHINRFFSGTPISRVTPRTYKQGHVVVLIGMRHAKVQTDLVQKIGLGQSNALCGEITLDIKNQAVSTLFQTVVVIKGAIRVTSIVVQGERFHQSGVAFVSREKGNPHARCGAAMHSI